MGDHPTSQTKKNTEVVTYTLKQSRGRLSENSVSAF